MAGVPPMEVGGKSKLGSWQFFFPPLFVQVGGEKTAQHPVCVVCRRPLIFGMFGLDGIMFEQENEPLPTVVDESSFLAAQFLSLQCRRYLRLCLGGNVSRRSTVSRCTYRIHFKGLIPFDVLASSQASFILGFGSRSKIAEFAGIGKNGDNLKPPPPPASTPSQRNRTGSRLEGSTFISMIDYGTRELLVFQGSPPTKSGDCPPPILDNDSIN